MEDAVQLHARRLPTDRRAVDAGRLGSSYRAEEIELVLKSSCLFSLLAVIEYANLANDEALAVARAGEDEGA